MAISRRSLLVMLPLGLMACGDSLRRYTGPPVTKIEVHKGRRRMYLLHNTEILRAYDIQLGFTAAGPKQFEGDGKTPEGRYMIDRRNPNSAFYLSLGINYPKPDEVAFAQAQGRSPGGDIFIHGWGDKRRERSADWTAGCIAVTNDEMREIYLMVQNGTTIDIFP
jgi:murein L,D-transpeptidase YafK